MLESQIFYSVCHRAGFVLLYVTKPGCFMLLATELSLFCCMLQNLIVVCYFCFAVCYKTWLLYAVCCSMLQNLIVVCCRAFGKHNFCCVAEPDYCFMVEQTHMPMQSLFSSPILWRHCLHVEFHWLRSLITMYQSCSLITVMFVSPVHWPQSLITFCQFCLLTPVNC